jgi:hypothetical protein
MLPLEPWIQIPPPAPSNTDVGIPRHIGSLQQKYKEISATLKILRATSGFHSGSAAEWVATLTTSIGPVTFSLSNTFYKEEDAKNWCNANVILAYDIKESNTDKAFEAYQLAMVQYNIDLANYHKDVEVYSNKMAVWVKQNSEWLSSKYPAPSRPGPRPSKPATPAVDPGPMPVQPNPPIRPIDPRDRSPVRPGRPGRPLPPRPGQS